MVNEFLDSWVQKRIDYELMAKGRAKLNNDAWRKLRGYHLKNFLKTLDNPFGFLFQLKFRHKHVYKQITCANKLYYSELSKRNERMGVSNAVHGQYRQNS